LNLCFKKNISQQTEEKIFNLINAALKRYSHEELFSGFLETIVNYKDRESVEKIAITDELFVEDVLNELDPSAQKTSNEQT
jgi:hypothetical protein